MKLYFALFFLIVLVVNFKSCTSEDLKLLILHNNDMHGRFEQTSPRSGVCKSADKKTDNCVGGFARTAHVIREARQEAQDRKGPNVLYLNAGDTYTGTPWFSVHRWKIVADFLNLLHPDVASFGNHEFDDKVAGVLPYIGAATFPIVAANLDFSKEPALQATNVSKSYVLEVAGKKIGVIGYLTPETAQIAAPENVIFLDEVAAIKEESERLDKEGVKIIIALGHSGYETDKKIAKEVPLVDLVVGGHTNTFLWNGPKPDLEEVQGPYPTIVQQSSGKKVPVVQAYAYTKYMGRLNIVFNDDGDAIDYHGQPQLLNKTVPQDQDFLNLLEVYRPEVDALDHEVVGRTRVLLDGSVESCRHKECNFANMVTDAYVTYHSSVYGGSFWTDTPIAIINGGGIRNSIEAKEIDGKITRGELLGAMPFQDSIVSMTLNGTDLLKSLEIGVRSNGETSFGELLQVAGIHYTVDRSKPVGSRVIEAKARCGLCNVPVYEPILGHKTYRIITTGFLNTGGDGHHIIRDKGYNKVIEDLTDIDTVVWYMNKATPVYPEEEERLIVVKAKDAKKGSGGGAGRLKVASIFILVLSGLGLSVLR